MVIILNSDSHENNLKQNENSLHLIKKFSLTKQYAIILENKLNKKINKERELEKIINDKNDKEKELLNQLKKYEKINENQTKEINKLNKKIQELIEINNEISCEKMIENDIKVLLCCIAKQENNYIREWVEHYRDLEFDNILIYDNNDRDGERFEEVINDYISDGFVIVKDVRSFDNSTIQSTLQTYCFTQCYEKYGEKYEWILFIDCDEFLELEYDSNVKDFLKRPEFKKFNNIRINWKNFTDSNIISVKDNDYSVKRFTEVLPKESWRNTETKSFIRCNVSQVKQISAHGCCELSACNVNGELVDSQYNTSCVIDKCIWEKAWINHYRTKTLEEFINQKMKRGVNQATVATGDSPANLLSNSLGVFFEYNEKTPEKLEYLNKLGINYE